MTHRTDDDIDSAPGSELRDLAADLLADKYGVEVRKEKRASGKKVDVFVEFTDLGRTRRLYVESKDWDHALKRSELAHIWADYMGIVARNKPAELLIVTRLGLTTDGAEFVEENSDVRHRTIWQLENDVFQLEPYVRSLVREFDADGLSSYYIEARATLEGLPSSSENKLIDNVREWLDSPGREPPLAILGGYGAGKSSFAKRFVSEQARIALKEPTARRPILIRLGSMTQQAPLKGLLGALFTADHRAVGYSFNGFMNLNRQGRFVILLDGFDEMKHAMSWAEFRTTVEELHKLVCEKARIILLGRPTAFMSEQEHFHVLRGLRPSGGGYAKIPGWPEYREWVLQDFSPPEREQFVRLYLAHVENLLASGRGEAPDTTWVSDRAREILEMTAADPMLFAKPVHSRLLVELAADPKFDLKALRARFSRWSLYESFFERLVEREASKPARMPIPANARLQFLSEIAFWLWVEKAGVTHFRSEDVPASIISGLEDGDAAEEGGKRREYLTGAFLEKKGADTYYFPHRSFAEFLVARRMLAQPPRPHRDHSLYSSIMTDGVLEFMNERTDDPTLDKWLVSLAGSRATISTTYVGTLLPAHARNPGRLNQTMWKVVFDYYREHTSSAAAASNSLRVLLDGISHGDHLTILSSVFLLLTDWPFRADTTNSALSEMMARLLSRLMGLATETANFQPLVIKGREGEALRELLVRGGVSVHQNNAGDRFLRLRPHDLIDAAHALLLNDGVELKGPPVGAPGARNHDLPVFDLLRLIPAGVRSNTKAFLRVPQPFKGLVVEQRTRSFPRSPSG